MKIILEEVIQETSDTIQKKAISYHSYKNQESKMDHINELDEETNYEDDFEIKSKK